ncbi:hypothetical protein BC829DRAFT_383926, partial [Chytridium lagenaria]
MSKGFFFFLWLQVNLFCCFFLCWSASSSSFLLLCNICFFVLAWGIGLFFRRKRLRYRPGFFFVCCFLPHFLLSLCWCRFCCFVFITCGF